MNIIYYFYNEYKIMHVEVYYQILFILFENIYIFFHLYNWNILLCERRCMEIIIKIYFEYILISVKYFQISGI